MSEINPISDLLERVRIELEDAKTNLQDAEADIEAANTEHRETMERLDREAAAAKANHQSALSNAVTRKMKAEGAIAALEELVNGR
jgi:predicted  nucleic acid-binding Zn-ribbon protein